MFSKSTIIASIIIFFIPLTVFGQLEKLLIDTTSNFNRPNHLSNTEIKEDIELLLFTLKTGYGLYSQLDSAIRGKLEVHLNEITKLSDISTDEFCKAIAQILSQIPDGHLLSLSNKQYCEIDSNKRKPSVGRNYYYNTNSVQHCWKLQFVKGKEKVIPVLSIVRFPSPQSKEWEGFEDAVKEFMNYKNVIVDLRGNTGGNDKMGYDLIATLNGDGITSVVEYFISKQTPAAYALLINGIILQIQNLNQRGQYIPPDIQKYLIEYREGFNLAFENKISENDTINFSGKLRGTPFFSKKFSGNIYILADAGCGSSGETVLEGMMTLQRSTFIGENTAGVVHSRNNGKIILPNSKIMVQMGTRFVKYLDNRFIEKIGYTPKISVPAGEDALEFTLKLLK